MITFQSYTISVPSKEHSDSSCLYASLKYTSSMEVRVTSADTACKNICSIFEQCFMACTFADAIISDTASVTSCRDIISAFRNSAISMARRHMSKARLASPDTAETFLK